LAAAAAQAPVVQPRRSGRSGKVMALAYNAAIRRAIAQWPICDRPTKDH